MVFSAIFLTFYFDIVLFGINPFWSHGNSSEGDPKQERRSFRHDLDWFFEEWLAPARTIDGRLRIDHW
jgi:hypothetical protein